MGFLHLPTIAKAGVKRRCRPPLPVERWLANSLLRPLGDPPVRIVFWDGTALGEEGRGTAGTLRIADRRSLWRLLANLALSFGDDFSAGRLEVQPDLVRFLESLYRSHRPWHKASPWKRYAANRLWLDQDLVYTCAYFPSQDTSLEAAQRTKMDYVCRKVRLKPGERVVETGCGWGALARHMARRYGVSVTAYNISREQVAEANRRAKAEGLEGQVIYVEDDYRNIRGEFDVFVSVSMLEHVGKAHYGKLGRAIDRSLTETGRGLIHSIGQNEPYPMNAWTERRIFPGAYPPTVREMMDVLEPPGFSILDVENLRLHCALTLRHWLARFEQHADEVHEMFDETFVRAWRLYLSASVANFSTGALQLFQVVFARPQRNEIPWTRKHLYTEQDEEIGSS